VVPWDKTYELSASGRNDLLSRNNRSSLVVASFSEWYGLEIPFFMIPSTSVILPFISTGSHRQLVDRQFAWARTSCHAVDIARGIPETFAALPVCVAPDPTS
jgi:hypothetical protein